MPKYVAFLRAINVGGHTVKMDHLRRLFGGLGFANVESFIASGNLIFDSSARNSRLVEQKIESCLLESLGYEVATFVRTVTEVAEIAQYKPFPKTELEAAENTVYIGFMSAKPDSKAIDRLRGLITPMDDFHLRGREVYWLRRGRFSESKVSGALLEKTLGLPATLRNSTTVRKIAAKYSTP